MFGVLEIKSWRLKVSFLWIVYGFFVLMVPHVFFLLLRTWGLASTCPNGILEQCLATRSIARWRSQQPETRSIQSLHWWHSSHFVSFFCFWYVFKFLFSNASFSLHAVCFVCEASNLFDLVLFCHAPCSSASADYLTMWLMFFAEGWTYSKWLQKQKEWNLCRHLGAHFGWDLRWGGMGQRLWRYIQRSKICALRLIKTC